MPSKLPQPTDAPAADARPSVLIVDDDSDVRTAIQEIVEDQGWRALCAANGQEALTVLRAELPTLMMVDLFMPVMNGVEFLKVVKQTRGLSRIPRVIMTAANDWMIGVKEDVSVLYKPLDLDAVIRLLQRYDARGSAPPGKNAAITR